MIQASPATPVPTFMSPLYGIGMAAMGRAGASLERAASNLANAGAGGDAAGGDVVSDMVTLSTAGIQFKIAASIVRSANETTGTLLDVLA
ncbi:MAG: hypothetical protein HOO96_37845 [Polyangiaceae bacterium]|nr:hypothetical protein [Polyangiaceae bacterium]